jgi:membrane-bound lytic murein transglycosylase A
MAFGLQASHADVSLQQVRFSDLAGWIDDDHAAALATFQLSCTEIIAQGSGFKRYPAFAGPREAWLDACADALKAADPRTFFETRFKAFEVKDAARPDGLLTGYYEPLAVGSLTQTAEFNVPVYARPHDLVAFDAKQKAASGLTYGRVIDGKPLAYFTRGEIEDGALSGRGLELLWLSDWADLFFMQVQGSGRVRLQDGTEVRLSYAAKSGLAYTAIGGVLIERGFLTKESTSMQAIRAWMQDNPQDARDLMHYNASYVFFRRVAIVEPKLGAVGAQHVHLTPERSLAVDRSIWAFGTPVWIDTLLPGQAPDATKVYRKLMVAQDTGSAIKGAARGDVYWGWGERAAIIAGHMKSPARMVVLLPTTVARSLGLAFEAP